MILGAYSAWGFASSFVVMAATGFATAGLILLGIRATGRSLEATVADGRSSAGAAADPA